MSEWNKQALGAGQDGNSAKIGGSSQFDVTFYFSAQKVAGISRNVMPPDFVTIWCYPRKVIKTYRNLSSRTVGGLPVFYRSLEPKQ